MTSKKLAPGKTQKSGKATRFPRRRTSKYQDIRDVVSTMASGLEHVVAVPKGVDSERFRNNLYHALWECREDGWLRFNRSKDLKSVIISFEAA